MQNLSNDTSQGQENQNTSVKFWELSNSQQHFLG